ncbi:MAG: hypothetical protein Q9161_004619 [Pseudevernia consocians]
MLPKPISLEVNLLAVLAVAGDRPGFDKQKLDVLNERVHSDLPLIRTLQEKLDNGKKSSDEQKSLIVDCNRQLYEMQFLLFFNPALHRMSDQRTAARLAANAHASTYKTLARPHKLETKACELLFGVKNQAKRDFLKRHAAIKNYKGVQGKSGQSLAI